MILFRIIPTTRYESARLYRLWLYYRLQRNRGRTGWPIEEARN